MKVIKNLTRKYISQFSELKKLLMLSDGQIVATFNEDWMVNEYFNSEEDFENWAKVNLA